MRGLNLIIWFWGLCMLAIWIRGGHGFCITETLPFAERSERFTSEYEIQALIALIFGAWGIAKLLQRLPNPNSSATPGPPRFRAGVILVPLGIFALAWLTQRIRVPVGFSDVISHSSFQSQNRSLAVLAVAVFAAVLAVRFFRNR